MSSTVRRRVFLHLGSPKTGTTYLQEILWRNREALRQVGLLYPGDQPEAHFQAAMNLQRMQFQDDWTDENVSSAWSRLVDQAREWSGDVVLSHELFCTADPAHIERAMSDLAFADVHLVCTARDLARQIPAVWQEDIKNRHVVSFAEFSAGVRGGPDESHWLSELFWQRQDLPEVLRKWAADVPADRVHVVTVPPAGGAAERLWERFAGLIGIDPDSFDTHMERPNRSLGVAETALVSRLNEALAVRIDWPSYDSVVKYQLATEILGKRAARNPIALPIEDRAWVQGQAKRLVSELSAAGYHVVGDLAELLPATPGARPLCHPDGAEDQDVLEVAVEALAALLERHAELERLTAEALAAAEPSPGRKESLYRFCERHVLLSWMWQLYRGLKTASFRLLPASTEAASTAEASNTARETVLRRIVLRRSPHGQAMTSPCREGDGVDRPDQSEAPQGHEQPVDSQRGSRVAV